MTSLYNDSIHIGSFATFVVQLPRRGLGDLPVTTRAKKLMVSQQRQAPRTWRGSRCRQNSIRLNTSQSTHIDIVKIATIVLHIMHFTLNRFDHLYGKVSLFKLLCAAQATGTEYVDFHKLIAYDV